MENEEKNQEEMDSAIRQAHGAEQRRSTSSPQDQGQIVVPTPADNLAPQELDAPQEEAANKPSAKASKKKKEAVADHPAAQSADEEVEEEHFVWPDGKGNWYVVHTYAGYEDAVAEALRQRIVSLNMADKIFAVVVPKEKQIEIKDGKRKVVERKIFPGYVLVNMDVTEKSWYVVRNTPNVTGFISSGTVPVPVSVNEIGNIKKRMEIEEPKYMVDLKGGDLVHITDGPFKDYDGVVSEVDEGKGKIKVLVSIFGRETPVELDFLQVRRV
jgi:transcriptional antiterminator NusG